MEERSVRRADRPCAMISVNFASTEPLLAAPGLLSFARTRRLCYAAEAGLLLAGLRDEIGGFDRARVLSPVVTRDH